jgi:hypothetical protein
MPQFSRYATCLAAAVTALFAAAAAAVECYPEVRMQQDLDSRSFTLRESVKAERMDLLAYASDAEKKWVIMARPEEGMVSGGVPGESTLCPLDAGDGDLEALKASPYFQKFFVR